MTKTIHIKDTIDATNNDLVEYLQSKEFNEAKTIIANGRLLDFKVILENETTTTELSREFIREIPEIAKSFIGNQIIAHESFSWNAQLNYAFIKIKIEKAPLDIQGEINLDESLEHTNLTLSLSITAQLPFIGRRVEEFAENIFMELFKNEVNLIKRNFKQQI